jgi:pyruvate dehydrogenase E1 component alpha subunit
MEGRDGNIHLGAFDRGTIPMISHLPEMLPVGMGVALSRVRRGLRSAALGFCGDGASAGGVFHETLNLAALWIAPLVIVVERNGYAYMTREAQYLTVDRLSDRAAGYGISGTTVDGNDVLAVYRAARDALERARGGGGPSLIEAFTYRMHGHGAHDAQKYVPDDELAEWSTRDPLIRWRAMIEEYAIWSPDHQSELERRVGQDVEAALNDALAAAYPTIENLGESVFAR